MNLRHSIFAALILTLAFSGRGFAADDPQAPIQPSDYTAPIRLACVGDSITVGVGSTNIAFMGYPSQLKRMLGDKWDVRNFGASGHTLLNSGDQPYQKDTPFQKAIAFNPNVVVIMLGTNDTKPQNWKFKDQFVADYQDLIGKFKALAAKPRIFICLPTPVPGIGNYGINEAGIDVEIPLIQNLAKTEGVGLIDMHTGFAGHDDFFHDRVHPTDAGHALLARAVYKALTGTDFAGDIPTTVTSQFGAYKMLTFMVDTRLCDLVIPNQPAAGNPWIWRTEFFGAYPQADVALLGKGYYVAYMDVTNMYGAPVALDHMDKFYDYLTKTYQLAPKTVLEGFSRGGLFAFNWAARHPDRVACIYADAPVCDFKTWPAGKGRLPASPNDWINLKKVYGFKTDDEALAYKLNPVDNLKPLADAKIPIIGVYGDADKTVPIEQNILLLETRYKALGGEIQTIAKPGGDHHPHSLPDPTPIVNFIVAHQS